MIKWTENELKPFCPKRQETQKMELPKKIKHGCSFLHLINFKNDLTLETNGLNGI